FLAQQQGAPSVDQTRLRERQLDSIRTLLRDAEAYQAAHAAYEKDRSLPRPRQDVVLASLGPALRGEQPVLFRANRASEIRQAIDFAREAKVKPIILGGRDAWMVTDLLKQHDVPVILTQVRALPSREDDPYDVNYTTPARLHAAGVRFAIASGDDGAHVRDLPHIAGMAVAFGLPKEAALRAVTLAPAQIFGIADRVGTLEPGKTANLVVTDGDLFEARTKALHLFIDGRPVPLSNRHEDLYQQFRERVK
ncbi:MAG TPA: amidohydrolase family protein, partial [Gemmatimonadaceae bacterium]|nr:amidohydrolase family protein [Gemmatimonadaceae bacterium]